MWQLFSHVIDHQNSWLIVRKIVSCSLKQDILTFFFLWFSVSQLPQWWQMPALHIPHSEMVHGKAWGKPHEGHQVILVSFIYYYCSKLIPWLHSNAATSRVTCKTFPVVWRVIRCCLVKCTAANASATAQTACQRAAASSRACCPGPNVATHARLRVTEAAAAHAPPALPRYRPLSRKLTFLTNETKKKPAAM